MALLLAGRPAGADDHVLFGVSGTALPNLVRIDTATGTATVVGPITFADDPDRGSADLFSLAFSPAVGKLIAVESVASLATDEIGSSFFNGTTTLYEIDPITAVATPLPATSPLISVFALTTDPADGTLLAVDDFITTQTFGRVINDDPFDFEVEFTEDSSSDLVRLDPATGEQIEVIGEIGFSESFSGIAINPLDGEIFVSGGRIFSDPMLSVIEEDRFGVFPAAIGPIGFPTVALEFDPATGALLGVDNSGNQLIQINPQTGVGTPIGPLGVFEVFGLAFVPAAVLVPEPGALLLTVIALAGAGVRRRR